MRFWTTSSDAFKVNYWNIRADNHGGCKNYTFNPLPEPRQWLKSNLKGFKEFTFKQLFVLQIPIEFEWKQIVRHGIE